MKETNIDQNKKPKQAASFISSGGAVGAVESGEKALTSPKQTFITSRELVKQHTRPKPTEGNLYDSLPPKAREHAMELDNEGRLLSSITDGINAGAKATKVLIALAQTLYEQSEYSGTTDRLLGLSEEVCKSTGLTISEGELGTRKNPEERVISPSPFIIVKLSDFAKLVNGTNKVGGKDIAEVKAILYQLDRQEVCINRGDGRYFFQSILHIWARDVDTNTGAEVMIINLKPIFTRAIATDFVTLRKDTLKVLSGRQKDITMRLMCYLVEMNSYKSLPLYPKVKISKEELFSRVAIQKQYERRKGDRERDFQEALRKMKELKLITAYTEETGAGGNTICVFMLNKNYTTEPIAEPRRLIASPSSAESLNLFNGDYEEQVY